MIMTLYKPGAKGSLRYYTIHDRQPLLTARYALTVAWRVGSGQEREKIHGFETRADMDKKIQQVFRRKIRDGYALLYSFAREHVSEPPLDGPLLSIAR
jgi:predicted DNA-binding WGR domain protein